MSQDINVTVGEAQPINIVIQDYSAVNIVIDFAGARLIDELDDVDIVSPSDKDVIQYNAASGRWENGVPVLPIQTVSADTVLDDSYHTVLCDMTDDPLTISLPAASTVDGRIYNIKKIDATAHAVTVDPNSTETIDGSATEVINVQWDGIRIQSNGSNWYKLLV